jgi:hypothetical protein
MCFLFKPEFIVGREWRGEIFEEEANSFSAKEMHPIESYSCSVHTYTQNSNYFLIFLIGIGSFFTLSVVLIEGKSKKGLTFESIFLIFIAI